ncbi:uncharacterized protein LOC141532038 [Cotesia typhae]|uniref:uncharacterized protein LOC141532038 n=1 Tax=Cotesia typhae TaxID=2053667 RepID=UPI003D691EED
MNLDVTCDVFDGFHVIPVEKRSSLICKYTGHALELEELATLHPSGLNVREKLFHFPKKLSDNPKLLKERHDDGVIRIRTVKFNDYSPSIQSKQTSTTVAAKQCPSKIPKNAAVNASAEYYRNLLPGTQPDPEKDKPHESDDELHNEELEDLSNDELHNEELEDLSDGTDAEDNGSFQNNRDGHKNDEVTPRRVLTESTNSQTSTSASRRPQQPRTRIKRPLQRPQKNLKLSKKTMRLEAMVDSLNKKVNKLIKKNQPIGQQRSQPNVSPLSYPNLTETVVVEGTQEFVVIDGLKIDADNMSDILMQKTMRRRANLVMREIWPPDVMKNMYLIRQDNVEVQTITTPEDRRKLKKICLYLQRRREIHYGEGSNDDINIHLKNWMSMAFRACRRKIKKPRKCS